MSAQDQLVTLKYNANPEQELAADEAPAAGRSWSVRPMLASFQSWLAEVLAQTKSDAARNDGGLYGVE